MDDGGPHLACLFCTQNCYNTHGKGLPPGPISPSFSKVITQSATAKTSKKSVLELPATFVKQHEHMLPDSADLQGPSGQTWTVDVCRSKYSTYFEKGWPTFSVDHVLCEGDIAVFKLTRKAYFTVQIFGEDGCEKNLYGAQNSVAFASQHEIPPAKKCQKRIYPQITVTERKKKRLKRTTPNSEDGYLEKDALDSTFCVDAAIKESAKNQQITLFKDPAITNVVNLEPGDFKGNTEDFRTRCRNGRARIWQEDLKGTPCVLPLAFMEADISTCCKEGTLARGGKRQYIKGGRPSTSCVRSVSDAMVAAKSHRCVDPFIIIEMKHSHVENGFWLNVGKEFSKKWLPNFNTDGFLFNSTGSRWKVRWNTKRAGFSAGWRRFSLDHGLQKNDICLLELTSREPLFVMIHMFRQNKKLN